MSLLVSASSSITNTRDMFMGLHFPPTTNTDAKVKSFQTENGSVFDIDTFGSLPKSAKSSSRETVERHFRHPVRLDTGHAEHRAGERDRPGRRWQRPVANRLDRKSTRLNSSHRCIS